MKGLYIIAAVTMAGVSSIFALLAEIETTYGIAQSNLGWIAGSAFVGALITQIWLARYADRGHATLLLRIGVLASAFGLLWFGFADELWQFIAARTLLGAGVGMIIPPSRRFIIISSGEQQGARLGAFYGFYLCGFVFGPPISGALTVLFDVRAPFFVLGIATALSALAIKGLVIPSADNSDTKKKRVLIKLISKREMVAALLVVASFRYSIGVFEPLWAPHLSNLGAGTMLITLSLTGFALPMLIISKWAGALSDRFGSRITSLLSAFATVPLMASYGYIGSIPILMIAAMPHGIFEAAQSPGSQAAVSDAAGTDDAAAAQGLGEAVGSVFSLIGALSAAPIYVHLGAGLAWFSSALIMLALLTASWLIHPPVVRKH